MRERKSARILVLDKNSRVLLFYFFHQQRTGKNRSCWATPGGEIEKNETPVETAKRELYEETGIDVSISSLGNYIWENEFIFHINPGEKVLAHEYFFVERLDSIPTISNNCWTQQEHEVISKYKWWSLTELETKAKNEVIYPENIVELLKK